MRRRRQALQVSTFPFLAVLLCAMGALILLLLVIDRRAKIAARQRVLHAQQQLAEERAKARERQLAEHERKRAERAEEARRQERQLAEKANEARKKAETTRSNLDKEETRYRELQRQYQALRGRLVRSEQDVVAVAAEADKAGAAEDATRQGRRRLTEQLATLEAVLANLKEMREREKKTYSLVPYLGKRGQNRKPIYVECQGEAVIFHPDARELKGFALIETSIRREVEERIARQRAGPEPPAKDEAPYLFLLVRPEGVATYYLVQNSLLGMKVEFGYEFVDADWALDFSGRGDLPAPWKRVAGPPLKLEPKGNSAPPVVSRTGQVAYTGGRPGGMPGGGGSGAGSSLFPELDLFVMVKGGRVGGGNSGPESILGALLPNTADTAVAQNTWSLGATAVSAVEGPRLSPNRLSSSNGAGGTANAAPGLPGPARGTLAGPMDVAAKPGPPDGMVTLAPISPGGKTPPGQGGSSLGKPGFSAGEGPGQTAYSAGEAARAGAGIGIPGGAGGRAEPASDAPPTPLLSSTPLPGAARGTKAVSDVPPLTRVRVRNRDWVIPIECQADGALLIPGRARFSITALAPTPGRVHPLAQAVQQLIARRQATVAPGDPPYRPRILFQVRAEGLRAYYLAYPLLDGLRLPMARENVSARAAPSNRPTIFDP